MLRVKKIYPWLSCVLLLFIIFCSIGTIGVQVKTNNTDSNNTITQNGFSIDKEGYLILNITNPSEHDIYNISFDIEFVGGILFFKANSETDVFVEHLPSGETVEVKSNDPIIKPKPIIGRPLFFGKYILTIDGAQCRAYGLFIYLFSIS